MTGTRLYINTYIHTVKKVTPYWKQSVKTIKVIRKFEGVN